MEIMKKYEDSEGLVTVVTEGEGGLKRAIFKLLKLRNGKKIIIETKNYEYGIIILSGSCDLIGDEFMYKNVGKRSDVFSGKPTGIYIPIETKFEIRSLSENMEIALCIAKSKIKTNPVLISPEEVVEVDLGVLNWRRKAYFIIDERVKCENLYIGETYLSPGKWAFPPHRHDYDNYPEEVEMDEIYHYRINPKNGFGVQFFYTDDKSKDYSFTIRNGDTCYFPEGYHPAAASPVDSMYILWFLAGKKRFFISKPDEQYKWIKNCESLLN
ncbi:MAG: 5-deoxy-glucuronate isomerase [Actinobacteria bacterium]|nr:5-deoxy-glucuronate isomerase [Actinomycetota bacterium]